MSARNVHLYYAEQLTNHARGTANNRVLALRAWFRWAVAKDLRPDDPTEGISIKMPKVKPTPPYRPEDVAALLDACDNERDLALLLLAQTTGARLNELVTMTTTHLDWANGRIKLMGKGERERYVAPSAEALAVLRHYLSGRVGKVWLSYRDGQPLTRSGMWAIMRKLRKRSDVMDAGWHKYRHSFAQHFLRRSGNLLALKILLGHSTWRMVERYASYAAEEVALEEQRRMHDEDAIASRPPGAAAGAG